MVTLWRYLTSSKRSLPDFIIIGAMKSGTSILYNRFLSQHPCIQRATKKEIHFFDNKYSKGILWYKSHFPTLKEKNNFKVKNSQNMLIGEASPFYIFYPHTARRVYEVLPKVKLIAILRNPVDRAYSHYHHIVRNNKENLSFEAAIESEPKRISEEKERMIQDENFQGKIFIRHSYLARGIYVDQLQEWVKFFPKEQILVLRTEDLKSNQSKTLQKVFQFLNVPNVEISEQKRPRNKKYPDMQPETRRHLIEYFKPHNERLAKFWDMDFEWDK